MAEVSFPGSLFFYCLPQGPPDHAAYQHTIICLAEGLQQLGISFFSNVDYWNPSQDKNEYLFNHNPKIAPHDCSVVVMNAPWFSYGEKIPSELFHPKRKYLTVFIDDSDEHLTLAGREEFSQFDLILRTHWNARWKYPSNMRPWAFGLSNRMIQSLFRQNPETERVKKILVNHRVNHPVRKEASKRFLSGVNRILPVDESLDSMDIPPEDPFHRLMWVQTGRRHHPAYFHRMQKTLACACFGGYFLIHSFYDRKILRRLWYAAAKRFDLISNRVAQWDSWRLWEAFAAGSLVFHLDFEKYGMLLPVMPRNWENYIGVSLTHPGQTIGRIETEMDRLQDIAQNGQKWALENYSPAATARRFLEAISAIT
jgi:hypothetical protein